MKTEGLTVVRLFWFFNHFFMKAQILIFYFFFFKLFFFAGASMSTPYWLYQVSFILILCVYVTLVNKAGTVQIFLFPKSKQTCNLLN